MSWPIEISLVVEGDLDEAVLRKVLSRVAPNSVINTVYGKKGKSYIEKNIHHYNEAARHVGNWIVLVDLNGHGYKCPPLLIQHWLPHGVSNNLLFRVAVHEIESWLMGDKAELSRFLRISESRIPEAPDDEPNPKKALVNLARRSRSKQIQQEMVPAQGSTASIGPLYTSRLIEFAIEHWEPERAAPRAPSLGRCMQAIRRLVQN